MILFNWDMTIAGNYLYIMSFSTPNRKKKIKTAVLIGGVLKSKFMKQLCMNILICHFLNCDYQN